MNDFNMQLKQYRILSNLTQEDLASEINTIYNYPISKSTISQLENGHIEPNIELLICFADYFNLSINKLLGLDSNDNSYELKFKIEKMKLEIINNLINQFQDIDTVDIYNLDRLIKQFFIDIDQNTL